MFTVRNVGERTVEIVVRRALVSEITPILPKQEIAVERFTIDRETVIVGRDGDRIDVRSA